jgi:hypothetical protein
VADHALHAIVVDGRGDEDESIALSEMASFTRKNPTSDRTTALPPCTPTHFSFRRRGFRRQAHMIRALGLPPTSTTEPSRLRSRRPTAPRWRSRAGATRCLRDARRGLRRSAARLAQPALAADTLPIIALQGSGPIEDSDDAVVKYKSSHLDGLASAYIVHSGHATQSNPYTIAEVRRILLLHAADACARIACGREDGFIG